MRHGSCLCKQVRWHYHGTIERTTHCHCSMCRKAHAAAFASYAMGQRAGFEFDAGEQAISAFESSPGFVRSFCSACGSVVPNTHLGELVAIPLAGFDDEAGLAADAHIFVASKAPWHDISDTLPRYDAYPESDTPVVTRPTLIPASEPGLRGSCLCGEVAFRVSGAFLAVHNCHCSRCRKARMAAHTTNGFTALDDVTFTRGESNLVLYRLPDARFFSQAFCRRCGSGMPRINPERGVSLVPFGALDDDPERRADDHIFVASKSAWYPITDALPRFEAGPPA